MSSRHARTQARGAARALVATALSAVVLIPMGSGPANAAAPAAATTSAASASAEAKSKAAKKFPNIRTWNRLAGCESDRRWRVNTGNGYYGGLQFSASTWSGYGGGRFASYANRATKVEQITIARKVRQGQGWGAWPHCSSKLGLGKR